MSARFTIDGKRRRSTLSMAPLIDVTFILLIFFMVVTQFGRFVPVDVMMRKAPAQTLQLPYRSMSGEKRLHLRIRVDGLFELDGKEIGGLEGLTNLLSRHSYATETNSGKKPLLQLAPDGEVSVQLLIDTMNALNRLPAYAVRIMMQETTTPYSRVEDSEDDKGNRPTNSMTEEAEQ